MLFIEWFEFNKRILKGKESIIKFNDHLLKKYHDWFRIFKFIFIRNFIQDGIINTSI